MSIIIKSNQLNTIVYKYLLEAGLSHSAYTFFNQAKLQSSLQQFKYDIKSGHLLMLLQKALIFSQIQSHVNFGEYKQCLQPFYLLKSHTCKITQKIKTDQNNFLKQLNNNITQCIKRTNAIYNTQLINKNYQQIIYDPRGMNYFQKFQKLKVTDTEIIQTQNYEQRQPIVKIDGTKDDVMAIWNRIQNVIYITKNDGLEDTIINKVYPCTLNGQISTLKYFKLTPNTIIMVFNDNQIKLINRQDDKSLELAIPLRQTINCIQCNSNIQNLITFQSDSEYFVLNIKNMEEISRGHGIFKWRNFDQYVLFDSVNSGKIFLKSIVKQQPIITYLPLDTEQSKYVKIDQIQISPNKTFFFAIGYKKNKIWVYTFQKQEPLYVFDFGDDEEKIRKVIWAHRNEVDYLCILSDQALRVWQVELNSYCLRIELDKYDMGQLQSIASLERTDTQTYLLILGEHNLLVSDIGNQKLQRVQSPVSANQMLNVGKNSVFVSTDQNIYFLDGQRLSQLFK